MRTHSFSVDLAEKLGVEKALLISHLYFWWEKNKLNDKHHYDGRYWTYNSARSFQAQFPYLSKSSISRHLKSLEEDGWIVVGNYNKFKADRTKWYSLSGKCISHFGTPTFLKMGNDISQNGPAIPYINTDKDTDIKTPYSPPRSNPLFGFDEFWKAYPNRKAKENARKAWRKLKVDDALLQVILAGVERHKMCDDWQKDGGKFIPHPATWLNAKRWEDELDGSGCFGDEDFSMD